MSQYGKHPPPKHDKAALNSAYIPHPRWSFETTGESMTKQSMAEECDINNIVRRYTQTGVIEHFNQYQARYADLGTGLDFQEAMQTVTAARQMFGTLPAELRQEFGNDPASFLDFAADPANAERMIELGLAERVGEGSQSGLEAAVSSPPSDPAPAPDPSPEPSEGSDGAG